MSSTSLYRANALIRLEDKFGGLDASIIGEAAEALWKGNTNFIMNHFVKVKPYSYYHVTISLGRHQHIIQDSIFHIAEPQWTSKECDYNRIWRRHALLPQSHKNNRIHRNTVMKLSVFDSSTTTDLDSPSAVTDVDFPTPTDDINISTQMTDHTT